MQTTFIDEGTAMANLLDSWDNFPKIGLIVVGDKKFKKFYPLNEAIPLWNSGMVRVEDSGEILMPDFSIRQMTDEENRAFQELVDEFSAHI